MANNLKDESQKLKSTITSEADKLLSKTYIKEGDRSPEDVLSHTTNDYTTTDHVQSSIGKKAGDANQAAFNAANKFKQAKENVSNEIDKDVNKVSGLFKSEKDKLINEQNPMVREKISSDKTKPSWESRLEKNATEKIHDTSSLVEKDTEKVKQVWDDKTGSAKASLYNVESDIKTAIDEKTHSVKDTASSLGHGIKSSLFSLFGSSGETVNDGSRIPWESRLASENAIPRKTDQDIINSTKPATPGKKGTSFDYYQPVEIDGNPMVLEKRSAEKTKPLWESSLEEHAQEVVHDTSTLVDKDTEKVKQGVWDAKTIANEKAGTIINHQSKQEGGGFWSTLFSTEKKVANQAEDYAEEAEHKWEGLKAKVDVTKDDVKENATQTWQEAKDKAAYEASRAKDNVTSTINDLSNKSSKEASRLESGWNNLKIDASYETEQAAEQARQKAEDAANNVANKVKRETNKVGSDVTNTAKDVKDEGVRLTRQASDHIASSLNEVSSKAEDLKYKAEDTAKSWYQKGTEQVKTSINTVKNVADQDINWVEEKLHNGVEGIQGTLSGAKEEVDRLLGLRDGRQEGYQGHVVRGEKFAEDEAGQLRPTSSNIGLKPAEVVVEQAHSKDM